MLIRLTTLFLVGMVASASAQGISTTPRSFCSTTTTINQTANTQVITGTAGQRIYFCSISLWNGGTAQSVNIVEGTGVTCATGPSGLLGGPTAATGFSFAANSGFITGHPFPILRSKTAGDNICIFQSGATQLSGFLWWVSAP